MTDTRPPLEEPDLRKIINAIQNAAPDGQLTLVDVTNVCGILIGITTDGDVSKQSKIIARIVSGLRQEEDEDAPKGRLI